jgi:ADP-ribose pyrophosphatase YjhB (NUDIX family)
MVDKISSWKFTEEFVTESEPMRDARARAEELGIEIEVLGLACIAETIDQGDGRHWVAPVYHARLVSGTPQILEPEKHGGWGWFEIDDVPTVLTSAARAFLETIRPLK